MRTPLQMAVAFARGNAKTSARDRPVVWIVCDLRQRIEATSAPVFQEAVVRKWQEVTCEIHVPGGERM